jgi:hypothetical protein
VKKKTLIGTAISIIVSLIFSNSVLAFPGGVPHFDLSWSPATLTLEMFPGQWTSSTVQFTSNERLKDVVLSPDEILQPFVDIPTNSFDSVAEGTPYNVTVNVTLPRDAPLGTEYHGNIVFTVKNNKNYTRYFPIDIKVIDQITGVIAYRGIIPIVGAEVRLRSMPSGVTYSTTTTDAYGRYSFTGIPWGDYQVYPESGDAAWSDHHLWTWISYGATKVTLSPDSPYAVVNFKACKKLFITTPFDNSGIGHWFQTVDMGTNLVFNWASDPDAASYSVQIYYYNPWGWIYTAWVTTNTATIPFSLTPDKEYGIIIEAYDSNNIETSFYEFYGNAYINYPAYPASSAMVNVSASVMPTDLHFGDSLHISGNLTYVGPDTPILGVPVITVWSLDSQGRPTTAVSTWFINKYGQLSTSKSPFCIRTGKVFSYSIDWNLTKGNGQPVPPGNYQVQMTISSPKPDYTTSWLLAGFHTTVPISIS